MTTMSGHLVADGLGLRHLYLLQTVSRFSFFRENSYPVICSYLQVILVDYFLDQVISSNFSERACLWRFMQKVYSAVRFLIACFFYRIFKHRVSQSTIHRFTMFFHLRCIIHFTTICQVIMCLNECAKSTSLQILKYYSITYILNRCPFKHGKKKVYFCFLC